MQLPASSQPASGERVMRKHLTVIHAERQDFSCWEVLIDKLVVFSIKRESGCIEWTRSFMKSSGYGQLKCWAGRKNTNTHKLSYIAFVGPVPHGICVLHRCDNRKCLNP